LNIESLYPVAFEIGGGFTIGAVIGYALKKVVKLVAIVVGLFFAGVAYLQYQQVLNINWNKLQAVSQNTLSSLANSTMHIPVVNNNAQTTILSNLAIPLTGSMSMGFAIGFLKA
jgi:uncharacterized membrane protein (Fun14 family)